MIELLVRHLALLVIAAVLARFLRKRSAALRHALWAVALGLTLLLPLLQRVSIALPEALVEPASAVASSAEKEPSRAHIDGLRVVPALTPTPSRRPASWSALTLVAYGLVALCLVLRWALGWTLAVRLARGGAPLGHARGVPVIAVEGVGPLTFGWPNARIIVPSDGFALEKPVLRHEVAHVERADFLWQALAQLACALWWFSPAVWLAARELRREAERACDDIVLSQGASAPDYADCLLEVASMKPTRLLAAALPLIEGELSARISALLALKKDRRPAAPLAVLGLTALMVPVGLTLTRPVAAEPPPAQAPREVPVVPVVRPIPIKRLLPAPQPPAAASKSLPAPVPVGALPVPAASPVPAPPAGVVALLPAPAEPAPSAVLSGTVPILGNLFRPAASPAPTTPASADPFASSPAPQSLQGKHIVLDPGHGGNDRGAPSAPIEVPEIQLGGPTLRTQVYEKDITLELAKRTAEALRKEGAIVTLTRDGDSFLSLQDRAKLSADQDLFLSLHIDSGLPQGKASEAAPFKVRLWYHGDLAAPPPAGSLALVQSVLSALAPVSASPAPPPPAEPQEGAGRVVVEVPLNLAISPVSETALEGTVAPDSKVYPSSGFGVLRNAKCPAYLIDFGNMSRVNDVKKLRDPAFREKLVRGLVEGAKAVLPSR